MPYGAQYFFTIVREPDFDEKIMEIARTYKRAAELDEAIDWALSRHPHRFSELTAEYYLWVTEELVNPDFPQLRILYRIVERTVFLIDVQLA